MQIDYEKETAEIISRLEQTGYSAKTIIAHQRCYDSLKMYLAAANLPFTMDAALEWLDIRKSNWVYSTYSLYRGALFRLEKYIFSGSITRGYSRGVDDVIFQGKLTDRYTTLLRVFRLYLQTKCGEDKVERYTSDCKNFLVFLSDQGLDSLSKMSIEQIVEYWQHICETQCTDSKKHRYISAIVNLLSYLAECGDIPRCYSRVLPRNGAVALLPSLKIDAVGTAFQPSKKIEPLAAEFLSTLDEQRYNVLSKRLCGNDFANYFMFIEVNHLEYSPESVKLWLDHSRPNALWKQRRHTLSLFADYLATGSTNKESNYAWKPLQIDSLPDWCRNIILGFVAERQREGLSQSTLATCRMAGYRFFKFLDSRGVWDARKITPELIKEFHKTDKHTTSESKNTYGTKIRQLLLYMAEQKLVPQNLFLAISTQYAPSRNIVSIMSSEMESAVYRYRAEATTPFELRNAAMTMLGLRMGIRGCDIVNLKIDDFDWQKWTVSFIQKKTRKAITLPVPIDVGNSVYKYIMEGRPKSGAKGDGCVFIRHFAPFSEMKTNNACQHALRKILATYGLKLPYGQGFHITRKTFATRLLTSKNSMDDISNALGHVLPETAEVYLARDEDGMRLCPLSFESVGAV